MQERFLPVGDAASWRGISSPVRTSRRFDDLTQEQFARAMGISVHTLRNWEQGRRRPEGSALALLRITARHPQILRANLDSAA